MELIPPCHGTGMGVLKLFFRSWFYSPTVSRADPFVPKGIASGLNLQIHSFRAEAVIFCYDRFSHVQAVVVKLDNLLAIHADEVSVAGVIGKIGIVQGGGLTDADLA